MISSEPEMKQHLFALLQTQLKQEAADRMLLVIQERLMAHKKPHLSVEQATKLVASVYTEHTRVFRKQSMTGLKHIRKVLEERAWGTPTIELKKH